MMGPLRRSTARAASGNVPEVGAGPGGPAITIVGMYGMNLALLLVPMGCGSLLNMLGW